MPVDLEEHMLPVVAQSLVAVVADKPMNILFHCFGGINRSAAILCAWLIAAHDYSAQEAIQILLRRRTFPSTVETSRLRVGCLMVGGKKQTSMAARLRDGLDNSVTSRVRMQSHRKGINRRRQRYESV